MVQLSTMQPQPHWLEELLFAKCTSDLGSFTQLLYRVIDTPQRCLIEALRFHLHRFSLQVAQNKNSAFFSFQLTFSVWHHKRKQHTASVCNGNCFGAICADWLR
jgi:hypothetical protein